LGKALLKRPAPGAKVIGKTYESSEDGK
jgi:hypothetical protein